MKPSFCFPRSFLRRGSALLIVLAFLLLLTTLTVAFLSRATMERQMSNASYSQGKTDMVAQGAVATIIADLQQEIVAGSAASSSTPAVASGYYYPSSPLTAVPAMVVAGSSSTYTPSTIVGTGMENLVKESVNGQPFWPSSANYSKAGPSRASSISTSTSSFNNRSVSAARWNAPLLLALANPSNTSTYTPVSTFPVPSWIYVARDGTNPTSTWSSSYEYLPNIAPTTATSTTTPGGDPVTQRYAYTIYNEGGTLDMNVAGSPIQTTGSYTANQPYKNALPYADLTQLPYLSTTAQTVAGSTSTTLTAAQQKVLINAIVGWRNNSSDAVTAGKFPGSGGTATAYTFATSTGTVSSPAIFPSGCSLPPSDVNIISNPFGFLSVGGIMTRGLNKASVNGNFPNVATRTDNAFTSRQQLIQFFTQGLGQYSGSTGPSLAALVNALPYLGTFSRGLNQPSYAPPPLSSVTGSTASPYTTSATGRPAVLPTANGGNNAVGLDDQINTGFLSSAVQVKTAYTHNDGSSAVVGSPLVNKRFALSRLAWLTYKGPSATRTMTDADMKALMNYGIPETYLLKGTAANIQAYFGLDWDSTNNRWKYDYHNSGGAPASGSSSAIMKLGDIANLGTNSRDPDFFELLKAGMSVGSLGKSLVASNNVTITGGYPTSSATELFPANYYYPLEESVDPQVIQIGANIIDQYQTAGYPVRIYFNNGALSFGREYVSVENYPYFYAVQSGAIPAVQPVASTATVTTDGVVVATQWPIIWNPHDPNSSIGAVYPTAFRILADQSDPDTLTGGTSGTTGLVTNTLLAYSNVSSGSNSGPQNSNTGTTNVTLDNTFSNYKPGNNTLTSNYSLASSTSATSSAYSSNSTIELDITGNHSLMFHDPTIIMTAGGGSLNATSFTYGSSSYSAKLLALPSDTVIQNIAGATNAGIPCKVANPTGSNTTNDSTGISYNQSANQKYLGFYLGAFPAAWKNNSATGTNTTVFAANAFIATVNGTANGNMIGTYITYRMQYQDPTNSSNWITYDTKYGCPFGAGVTSQGNDNGIGYPFQWSHDTSSTGTASPNGNDMGGSWNYTCVSSDPRCHRFGLFTHYDAPTQQSGQTHVDTSVSAFYQCFLGQENAGAFTLNGTYEGGSYQLFETFWLNMTNNVMAPFRQDMMPGYYTEGPYNPSTSTGWNMGTEPSGNFFMRPGLLSQNCTQLVCSGARNEVDGQINGQFAASDYYADPDGAVRRADGGYVAPGDSNSPVVDGIAANPNSEYGTADTTMGLPMVQVGSWGGGISAPSTGIYTQINNNSSSQTAGQLSTFALNTPSNGIPLQSVSRPYILHRPFRSVAEMGYAFRDEPWKSVNFSMPESGDSALLDIFTLNENYNMNGLEAGKVDLNTRQAPVLAALLANTYLDDPETNTGVFNSAKTAIIGGPAALSLGQNIVTRTTDSTDITVGSGPFQNVSDLVGKWGNQALTASPLVHPTGFSPAVSPATGPSNSSGFIDGMLAYVGFSGMPTPPAGTKVTSTVWTSSTSNSSSLDTSNNPNLMTLYTANSSASTFGVFPTTTAPIHAGLPEAMAYAKRYHEAPIRALANTTQTRVWNLMIDVIAQTGRFPSTATGLANFNVEGERRYWVHVAIDRYTGKVLDEQMEEVRE